MKILLLASAYSGLAQRVLREAIVLGHEVEQHYHLRIDILRRQLQTFNPDVILCPYLVQRIPDDILMHYLCLVVHPGIEGDRGPSSLDWCVALGQETWGVTLLQAAEEMDAGDIWGTRTFTVRAASKTSIYKREVSECAVQLIKEALEHIAGGNFKPRALEFSNPQVRGTWMPAISAADRRIDWMNDSTHSILRKIQSADTTPGVKDVLFDTEVRLYGAVPEPRLRGYPGQVVAQYKGAICRATRDGAVWVRQLKCINHVSVPSVKLPAAQVLTELRSGHQAIPDIGSVEVVGTAENIDTTAIEDISIVRDGTCAYVYFDFYNGAASTEQCQDLTRRLIELKQSDVQFIVLMGGVDFWSNGIHLNCIEASKDPPMESWHNINAIDDLVREVINCPEQITIAALRNNAGAGGAIVPLACDYVVIRDGVVLNPHYRSMGLFGSEYWTYLLPKKVGHTAARYLTDSCQPLLASEAMSMRYVDSVLCEDWTAFHEQLRDYIEHLKQTLDVDDFLLGKQQRRAEDEKRRPLADYRHVELGKMARAFFDPGSDYHRARRQFVYKLKAIDVSRTKHSTSLAQAIA
jgi:putative two-component system hydrogenase maturation factor HypX/HoxX